MIQLDLQSLEKGYRLLKPIPIVLEKREGYAEFLASFSEANIHTSGDTMPETLKNIKSLTVDVFERYSSLGAADRLVPGAKKTLSILESYIVKTEG